MPKPKEEKTKTVKCRFTVTFEVTMDVPENTSFVRIGELLADVEIPESDEVQYVADTFEPVVDAEGDVVLY